MRTIYDHLALCVAALALASLLALLNPSPAQAAGVVTDCTTYGPGPGTLAAALETDGLVTFACSGVIILPEQIAMYNNRRLVIDGSGQAVTLSGNNSTRLFNLGSGSSLHLHNLTLTAGYAPGGGAIQSAGFLTITNSALLSNTAGYGGALELFNGSVLIQNSTLAGNRATGSDPITSGGGAINQYFDPTSGGLFYEKPYVEIVNSTITGNSAAVSGRGGIWQENGRLAIRYSIVAGNGGGNCAINPPTINQQFVTVGSLDDDGTCFAAQQANPQLGPLDSAHSAAPLFPLLPHSPAIDAAPAAACAGHSDQRGSLRPRDGNRDGAAACDLGAYEYADRFMALAGAADGLIGYWKFDEGGGSAVMDSSGNRLTGALSSGAGFTAAHPALRFNTPFALQSSPAAGLQVPDAALLNPTGELTVAAWVRLASLRNQSMVAKLAGAGAPGYGLLIRDGALSAEVGDSAGARQVITGAITAGGWLHVALTYQQGGEMAAYINGRQVGVQAVAHALGVSAAPLVVAADGAVDDVRIYSRALPAGAVAALAAGRSCITDGTTWATAAPDLQCALLEAEAGAEVWVGPGVYRPTTGPDRTATFAVRNGVGVYGGFAGSEERRDQRQAQTPPPVLSGDIEVNDPVDASGVLTNPAALIGGNALHVVSISSTLTSTLLERLVITGGQADGGAAESAADLAASPANIDSIASIDSIDNAGAPCRDTCGGGLHITGGAPQLSGLLLAGNQASGWGGAIYAEQSSTWVISATLRANRAGSGGAAFWRGGAPALANSLVAGNQAANQGGGIYSLNSNLRLVNVTVAANAAGAAGGGLLLNGGAATAANVIVAANRAPAAPQLDGQGAAIAASLVEGGCPAAITCAADVQKGDPLFVRAAASTLTTLGDYHLQPTSPAIDRGDNNANLIAGAPQGATVAAIAADLDGAPRIRAARVLPPQIDLGAYEAAHSPPLFTTSPVTQGVTTVRYVYKVVAIAPHEPSTRLPITVVKKPDWLLFEPQANGAALLHGTPPADQAGDFEVVLRSTDSLDALSEQAFIIQVLPYTYLLYMPQVWR